MDKLTHHLEPPLGVLLPTPVTLVTFWWDHHHVFVELLECGHLTNHIAVCLKDCTNTGHSKAY